MNSLALVSEASDEVPAEDPVLQVVSDAAGRMRVSVDWLRGNSRRAVAVEETVAKEDGVRVVHAYPRTGSVVVWYSPRRCDRAAVLAAISGAAHVAAELIPARAPHSSEIRNSDVLRMVVGGAALALLGVRRYVFTRPPLLGPSGRLLATGVTVFTGYPFLRGALRSLRSGRVCVTRDLRGEVPTIKKKTGGKLRADGESAYAATKTQPAPSHGNWMLL